MATAELNEEQTVYVCLPYIYDEGKHILSWALSHFSKDETKIVATYIGPTSYRLFRNMWRKFYNETLDKHLAQCAIQKFKAEKLIHETDPLVEGTLGLIDSRAMKNLVMEFSPTNSELVKEKANPSCMIWFIQNGQLIDSRLPRFNPKATSEEQIRREKQHQEEIEEILMRENDKIDLHKRENEQLKLENQLQQNELDNAIKEAQELRRQKEHSFGNSDMVLGSQFSLRELEQATQNFSDSLKIGEGGFGCVYKGSLRNITVAIKKLNSESLQGLSEFQREVAILNRVRHPNIVNLIGSCSEISTLVYEFLPNGSLEDRLACADNTSSLKWQTRIRIISEICLGLVFLHSNKPHLVIHGDLKPANILLDANFISKLSDFGISRMIKQSDTNTTALYRTTHPAGTFAYVDPQFHSTGELTPKSDVYSFGIIVLRLLTGKRALNIANEVQEGMRAGRLLSIVDQSAGKWPFNLAEKLAKLGVRCADISRRTRPDMSQVWATIEPLVKDASLLSIGSSTSNEEHVPSHFICPIMQCDDKGKEVSSEYVEQREPQDANEEKNKVIIEQKELEEAEMISLPTKKAEFNYGSYTAPTTTYIDQLRVRPTQIVAFKGKDKESTSGAFVQECKYFSSPGGCKFGKSCRYLHPKGKPDVSPVQLNFLGLPIRPSKKECPNYMRTGSCKYSTYCKFNHPDPTAVASQGENRDNNNKKNNNYGSPKEKAAQTTQAHLPVPVPSVPSWPEQGTALKEPMQYVAAAPPSYAPEIMPPHGMFPNQDWNDNQVPVNPHFVPVENYQPANVSHASMHHQPPFDEYPERPGQPECQDFVWNGFCKYKHACKFHHPKGHASSNSPGALTSGAMTGPESS